MAFNNTSARVPPGAMAGAFHGGGIRALGALSGAVGIKLGDQLLWS